MADPSRMRRTLFRANNSSGSEQGASMYYALTATVSSTTDVTVLSVTGRGSLMYLRGYGATTLASGVVTVTIDGVQVRQNNISGEFGVVLAGRSGKVYLWDPGAFPQNPQSWTEYPHYWGSLHARGLVFMSSVVVTARATAGSLRVAYDYQLYE